MEIISVDFQDILSDANFFIFPTNRFQHVSTNYISMFSPHLSLFQLNILGLPHQSLSWMRGSVELLHFKISYVFSNELTDEYL